MNINGLNLKAALIAYDIPDILALMDDATLESRVTSETDKFIATNHPAANGASPEQIREIFHTAISNRLEEVLVSSIDKALPAIQSSDDEEMNAFADMVKRMGGYK